MKVYKPMTDGIGDAAFTLNGTGFFHVELSADEEKSIGKKALHDKYVIHHEWDFESHADNDGGIDAWDFGEEDLPIEPEESILWDGRVIGFFSYGRVFLLEKGAGYAGGRGPESIGGWGDVSSSSDWSLKLK